MRAARYVVMVLALCGTLPSFAQVPYERLLKSDSEPQNWLMYGGNYGSQRFSGLKEITPQNAKDLRLAWAYQMRGGGVMESSPLIVDGIMYLTEPPSNVNRRANGQAAVALRAADSTRFCAGRPFPYESRRGDPGRQPLPRDD